MPVCQEGRAGTLCSRRFLQRDLFSAVCVAIKKRVAELAEAM